MTLPFSFALLQIHFFTTTGQSIRHPDNTDLSSFNINGVWRSGYFFKTHIKGVLHVPAGGNRNNATGIINVQNRFGYIYTGITSLNLFARGRDFADGDGLVYTIQDVAIDFGFPVRAVHD